MENPILKHLRERQNVREADAAWLLTLFTIHPLDRYSLDDWNGALSAVLRRRVLCPSYRALNRYLQEAVLGVE